MKLYWHPFTLFPRRVRVVLREKRIPHEEVVVDLPGGATRGAAFRRLNPFGQLPVLEHDGLVVFESLAICEYLEESFPAPALLPSGAAARARARQWMHASGDYCAAPLKRWLPRVLAPAGSVDLADSERALAELAAHFDALERALAGQEFLAGDYSLADIAYVPLVCELAGAQLAQLLADRPALRAWVERLRARPAVAATAFGVG